MICEKYKFIFIHIPKVAGTSIRNALLSEYSSDILLNENNSLLTDWLNKNYPGTWPSHATALQLKQFMGHEKFKNYFKFCWVRHPLDRLVSLYFYVKQQELNNLSQNDKISEFNRSIIDSKDFKDWFINTNNLGTTQSSYIRDTNESSLIDYIGSFLDINSSFAYICGRLNLKKIDLPISNISNHKESLKYYDLPMINRVYKDFNQDIKLFKEV